MGQCTKLAVLLLAFAVLLLGVTALCQEHSQVKTASALRAVLNSGQLAPSSLLDSPFHHSLASHLSWQPGRKPQAALPRAE